MSCPIKTVPLLLKKKSERAHYLSKLRILGEKPAGCSKAELAPILIKGVGIGATLGEKQRQNKVV